tara:strand:+ start:612 stop:818 length:207 start_codon:yes stop_codon:yes gene_type:complete
MLQGMIINKVLELVMNKLLKTYKLDAIRDYVEKPNELDIEVKKMKDDFKKDKKKLEKKLDKVLKLVKK